MFNWLRRKRLSPEARRRLLLVAARAEEAIVETHVANLLDLIEALEDEVDLDRAIEIYIELVSLEESRSNTVSNRLLARLEEPTKGGRRKERFRNVFRNEARS
jgi:hypothetical protein